MARFFVSYSRSVKDEVRKVIDLLIASGHEVWWDGDIPIMADWWATILRKIEWCEVFIFVTSEKSVESLYCMAELKYANDRQRPILPFMLEDPASLKMPPQLPARNQWLMYDGNPANMLGQINRAYNLIDWQKFKDINARRPPEPNKDGVSLAKQYQEARQLAQNLEFEQSKQLLRNIKHLDYGEWGTYCDEWLERISSYEPLVELVNDESTYEKARRDWNTHVDQYGSDFDPYNIVQKLEKNVSSFPMWIPGLVVGAIVLAGTIWGLSILFSGANNEPQTSPTTEVTQEASNTPTDDLTPEPTDTPSQTATPSNTPDATEIEQTIVAQMVAIVAEEQATVDTANTQTAEAIIQSNRATAAVQTATANSWTATYTPDLRATAEARSTQNAQATIDTQSTADAQATANAHATGTQNALNAEGTANANATASQIALNAEGTANAHSTSTQVVLDITATAYAPIQLALEGVSSNDDWQPFEQEFDGVAMVLVPAGCFTMGSTDEQIDYAVELGGQRDWFTDEQPVHEVCFDDPFWIDRYEVTNEQYGSTGCESYSSEPDQPRNCVTWFDALAHCEARGASLPTEAQWEYAARGIDNLIYPWGNTYVIGNVIGADDPQYGGSSTAPVGSRPDGVSWVGAYDMSGNLWEWTSSIYEDYPYDASDGHEDSERTDVRRVLRGGSFNLTTFNLRSANRNRDDPDDTVNNLGFRCLRSYP